MVSCSKLACWFWAVAPTPPLTPIAFAPLHGKYILSKYYSPIFIEDKITWYHVHQTFGKKTQLLFILNKSSEEHQESWSRKWTMSSYSWGSWVSCQPGLAGPGWTYWAVASESGSGCPGRWGPGLHMLSLWSWGRSDWVGWDWEQLVGPQVLHQESHQDLQQPHQVELWRHEKQETDF